MSELKRVLQCTCVIIHATANSSKIGLLMHDKRQLMMQGQLGFLLFMRPHFMTVSARQPLDTGFRETSLHQQQMVKLPLLPDA